MALELTTLLELVVTLVFVTVLLVVVLVLAAVVLVVVVALVVVAVLVDANGGCCSGCWFVVFCDGSGLTFIVPGTVVAALAWVLMWVLP